MLWYSKEVYTMTEKLYMSAEEVADAMGISLSYAYKVVRELNAELKAKGFITVSGRINRQYFMERTCYNAGSQQERVS